MVTKGSFHGANNMGTFYFNHRFLDGTYFFRCPAFGYLISLFKYDEVFM